MNSLQQSQTHLAYGDIVIQYNFLSLFSITFYLHLFISFNLTSFSSAEFYDNVH